MSEACKLCKGACCESVMLPIDRNPMTAEFYRARGEVFYIHGQPVAEIASRCPSLSSTGKCKCYASRPVACIRFVVGSTMFPVSKLVETTYSTRNSSQSAPS